MKRNSPIFHELANVRCGLIAIFERFIASVMLVDINDVVAARNRQRLIAGILLGRSWLLI